MALYSYGQPPPFSPFAGLHKYVRAHKPASAVCARVRQCARMRTRIGARHYISDDVRSSSSLTTSYILMAVYTNGPIQQHYIFLNSHLVFFDGGYCVLSI